MMFSAFIKACFNIFHFRVKGGVLQLTLGIGVIISVICAAMILLVYLSNLHFLKQKLENDLSDNALSGIAYGMASRDQLNFNEVYSFDLFGEGIDSVDIIRKPWGMFEVLTAVAKRGSNEELKAAIITAQPDDVGRSALYIPENNSPIYLVGETTLVGTAYLPERKFSMGYIDGQGYNKKSFIEGDVKGSESVMPSLDTILIAQTKAFFKEAPDGYRVNRIDFLPVGQHLSFHGLPSNYYYSQQSIDLSDSISGNIIIQSGIRVRVTSKASLDNVIIIAPDIDIDNGFTGSVQCIAQRKIVIGSGAKLKYPSALLLAGEENDSSIVIKKDAVVEGVVVISGYDKSIGSRGILSIQKGAILHGMAYVNGRADIQGAIWGHLAARSVMAKIASAEYASHLFNAEINSVKRSAFLPGSLLWAHTEEIKIAEWID
ncbi:hypothetical protein [Chryseosolibacter indicus]|uniref:Polymer-forming cytoskeletal protein n=1 Tax=Chryseosolibacter indicus TaxID=2782351 RepID=A0ABS5VVL6_9BACT|nr:hypothetical protein [Chryseosolibacter indicus]MBT1705381.1 hypothetical protein [Chryseosolibacter indicus]